MIQYYPLAILLAPLAAALLTAQPNRWVGRRSYVAAALVQAAAFGLAVLVLHELAVTDREAIHLSLFSSPWEGLGTFKFSIDRLAAVMMVVITGIGTLIYVYSIRFMQPERGRARFHTLLAFSIFVLLCMVSSANLLMLFLFWQLMSWMVPLLSYNYAHPPTVKGAFRTFVVLRLGDVAFLAGIVLTYGLYGTLDFDQLFIRATEMRTSNPLFWFGSGIEIHSATLITLLIFIGAMSKSAQFPLHTWLPDSLYAPTPVHALLHAGIINAGGFLLNRLAPLYGLSPTTLHVVFAVGVVTALLGASMMLVQNDIKKTLGYSTIGQMGYMIMECGLGAFALAVFHLAAHGLFKATIFLHCGNVIHAARQDPKSPPKDKVEEEEEFSFITWITGFGATLILPLIILFAAHGVLNIPLWDSQGLVIFLFFSWVTSAQAILTLYRLQGAASLKVAALMLLTLFVVVFTYLWAAETFTHFLYPNPGEVNHYFRAAALPSGLFDLLIGGTALLIITAWILLYTKSHGRSIQMPGWYQRFHVRLYLFFMNRLYLDALLFRFGVGFRRGIHRLNQSRFFLPFLILVVLVWIGSGEFGEEIPSITNLIYFVLAALLLPLFPFHGLYVRVLTRFSGSLPIFLAVLLPAGGLYGLIHLLPELPRGFLNVVSGLALLGALYGSYKALVQVRLNHLVAWSGIALFSLLWWHLSVFGTWTSQRVVYAGSALLVIGGLFLARHIVAVRYGDFDLDRIGGLARTMPRFATLLVLLVMAATVPPFGLFSGFMTMLLDPFPGPSLHFSGSTSGHLIVILVVWFAASWYLFRMMQRLLFGPHRTDIFYEDLRPGEIAFFVMVLAGLLALGLAPHSIIGGDALADGSLLQVTDNWYSNSE